MKTLAYFGIVVGLSLIAGLILWQDASSISMVLLEINVGIFCLLPVYAIYLAMGVISWRLLFAPGRFSSTPFRPSGFALRPGATFFDLGRNSCLLFRPWPNRPAEAILSM